ncbi:LptA/OstA family protein [uncultured Selenomonas sp.]|uniref:LptA/OstA family protein n=1 Tax=uncultured Selenomonas sp. TaxID=159275 RepID=UPI0025E57BCB|nr:LptA/OstA family protein [uncultured Selenomonas sp.]
MELKAFKRRARRFAAAACALLLPAAVLFTAPQMAAADPVKPVVTADAKTYDENTGCYHLQGNVTVTSGDRVARMDDAQVSANVSLQKGDELVFTADAVYLEGFAPSATLFGRVNLERPGLVIRAESVTCDWKSGTATFHGHVICIENGREQVAGTLVYDMESGQVLKNS